MKTHAVKCIKLVWVVTLYRAFILNTDKHILFFFKTKSHHSPLNQLHAQHVYTEHMPSFPSIARQKLHHQK